MDPECDTCGGSGYTQGWIGPFAVSVLFLAPLAETTESAGGGASQEVVQGLVRLSALPRPRAGDALYISERGHSLIIGHPQKPVTGIAGFPAVVECPVRLPAEGDVDAVPPEDVTT